MISCHPLSLATHTCSVPCTCKSRLPCHPEPYFALSSRIGCTIGHKTPSVTASTSTVHVRPLSSLGQCLGQGAVHTCSNPTARGAGKASCGSFAGQVWTSRQHQINTKSTDLRSDQACGIKLMRNSHDATINGFFTQTVSQVSFV